MTRALWPALRGGIAVATESGDTTRASETRPLLGLFLLSSIAIAVFYGAGLMYGRQTHLAMVEYWRWWVVHLWVEGFFEVFATVVIAFLFVRLHLLEVRKATTAVFFSTSIFLAGGIIGTFHHLYFTGTPSGVLALGAVFSALEVVPLVLVGFEVWQNLGSPAPAPGSPPTSGPSTTSSPSPSGTSSEPACSASSSILPSPSITCRGSTRRRCTATPRSSGCTGCSASA